MKKFFLTIIFFIFLLKMSLAQQADINIITNPSILRQQAIISYNNSNYKDSLSYFQNINISYLEYDDFILIANCYDSVGYKEKAIDSLKKAIKLKPENYSAYYNLGLIYFSLNDTEKSINNFKKAISLNDSFFEAHYNLGIVFYNIKEYKKALKSFKNAEKLNPKNENTYYNTALTYKALKDIKNEKKYLDLVQKKQ